MVLPDAISSHIPYVKASIATPDLRSPHGAWISVPTLERLGAEATTAHRIFSGPDVWVERFGEDLLVSHKTAHALEPVLAGLPVWCQTHGLGWLRIFGKLLPLQNQERAAPVLLAGEPGLSLETVVEENGVRYGLDFGAGYSAGLFIDQRANRAFLRRSASKRVLNTFAYTCSFSVAAAMAQAVTTSVDLSRKSVDRGRDNFALNGLDASDGHRFYAEDVLEFWPRLARKKEQFDAIILDPPTFSRGARGRRFQVERDLEALFIAALELAAPRAKILISTNCTRLDRRALEAIARFGLKHVRRAASFHSEPELPDLASQYSAQTLWVLLKD